MGGEIQAKNEHRIEGDAVWIKLTQGKEACVDLADWPQVAGYRWYAIKGRHTFYAATTTYKPKKLVIKLHSLLCETGDRLVDHRDSNGCNNRRSNLRPASHQENTQNRKKRADARTSKYKGVSFNNRLERFVGTITLKGVNRHLGVFSDERDAARAYDTAATSLFGEFAHLNFPKPVLTSVALESHQQGGSYGIL